MSQKGFSPILIVLLVAILGIGGYFVYRNNQPKSEPTQITQPSPSSADETANWKTYSGQGYQIKIPADFTIEEDKQNNWVSFSKIIQKGVDEKSILLSRKETTATNPCDKKLEGYPNSQCKMIARYQSLDWGSDVPPVAMGPLTYIYTFINNGTEYEIQFLGIEETEKDQILSTFKFVDADETANWKTYTNSTYKFTLQYPSEWFFKDKADCGGPVISPIKDESRINVSSRLVVCGPYFSPGDTIEKLSSQAIGEGLSARSEQTSKSEINLQGHRVIKQTSYTREGGSGAPFVNIYTTEYYIDLSKGNPDVPSVLVFYIYNWEGQEVSIHQKTFDQIISSLKFTQ